MKERLSIGLDKLLDTAEKVAVMEVCVCPSFLFPLLIPSLPGRVERDAACFGSEREGG